MTAWISELYARKETPRSMPTATKRVWKWVLRGKPQPVPPRQTIEAEFPEAILPTDEVETLHAAFVAAVSADEDAAGFAALLPWPSSSAE